MSATAPLIKFADEEEKGTAPLAGLMRNTRAPPLALVTDTITKHAHPSINGDTVRLRHVWDAEKRRPGAKISQKAMALEWGVNASLITQYLNGHIKLNTEAKLRFAAYLKKPVLEIWPDFQFAAVAPGELSPESVIVAAMWSMLAPDKQKIALDLIRSLAGLTRSG
jgi:hypothetical protein